MCYAKCEWCRYESGFCDTVSDLEEKVKKDGGQMEYEHKFVPFLGHISGWKLTCPAGHKMNFAISE